MPIRELKLFLVTCEGDSCSVEQQWWAMSEERAAEKCRNAGWSTDGKTLCSLCKNGNKKPVGFSVKV